jgi:hypothetical protein
MEAAPTRAKACPGESSVIPQVKLNDGADTVRPPQFRLGILAFPRTPLALCIKLIILPGREWPDRAGR